MADQEQIYSNFQARINAAAAEEELTGMGSEIDELVAKGTLSHFVKDTLQSSIAARKITLADEVGKVKRAGKYFVDARDLYDLKPVELSTLLDPFDARREGSIGRAGTPVFYEHITNATTAVAKKRSAQQLQNQAHVKKMGGNPEVRNEDKDIFGKSSSGRAHLFLDSDTCAPAWGHMAEGATGMIEGEENQMKNAIRLCRLMGTETSKHESLRYDIHNFIPLYGDHKKFFGKNPQLILVPTCKHSKIMGFDGAEELEVAVLVSSLGNASERSVADIYKELIPSDYWDAPNTDNECSELELEQVFKNLRCFTKALGHSLREGLPQALLEASKKRGSGSRNGRDSQSSRNGRDSQSSRNGGSSRGSEGSEGLHQKTQELNRTLEELEGNLLLPHLKTFEGQLPKVMKLKLKVRNSRSGVRFAPDPWLMMVKAAVNFYWAACRKKLLPACVPPPDKSREDDESIGIPMALTIPATPEANVAGGNPAATVTPPGPWTPPDQHFLSDSDVYDSLSDVSE